MQFLTINGSTTLPELSEKLGYNNVQSVLHLNNVPRVPNIGKKFLDQCAAIAQDTPNVSTQRKISLLNNLTSDSDVFEAAATSSSSGWKLLSAVGTISGCLRVPDSIRIPDSTDVLGNSVAVAADIYQKTISSIQNAPHYVDPSIFNTYSYQRPSNIISGARVGGSSGNPMQLFKIPWGEITLYSSISKESIDFPVYPKEVSNSAKASYTTMPDILYQYEPWQIYTSSGPRTQTYSFDFHRDMWTGDHRDGKANELIRACMANCYPEYRGSAVNTPRVTLYISGNAVISGILTDVDVSWDGPIGLDNWYLHCTLSITITEVSDHPIDYYYMKNKPLIS